MTQTRSNLLNQILDPLARCFTPEVAGKIAALRATPELQERLELLADRCTEGQLTDEERAEYEAYVRALNLVSILQAKARAILAERLPD